MFFNDAKHSIGCNIHVFHIFSQKRDQLQDEEERKSSWVSQERQKTLDRLRTFKQVTEEELLFSTSFFCKTKFLSFQNYTMLLPILFHCVVNCSLENSQQSTALVVTDSSGRCIPSAVISFCSLLHLYFVKRRLANVL